MQIIAFNPMERVRRINEHGEILRRLLTQRAQQWQNQKGIRRLITRIKIEFWAWGETAREQRRIHHDDSPYKM
jgi:hypothetical protein